MKHFEIFLRKKITETDLSIQELVQRKDLRGKDHLVISTQDAFAYLWKYTRLTDRMDLKEHLFPMLKTAYTGIADRLILSAAGKAYSTAFVEEATDRMRLESTIANALDTKYAVAQDTLKLASSTVKEMDTVKYIPFNSVMLLTDLMDCALWLITKFTSVEQLSYLLTNMAAYNTVYGAGRNIVELSTGNVMSRLVRFRTLGETFPLTLESMLDRTLDDLIVEIIE